MIRFVNLSDIEDYKFAFFDGGDSSFLGGGAVWNTWYEFEDWMKRRSEGDDDHIRSFRADLLEECRSVFPKTWPWGHGDETAFQAGVKAARREVQQAIGETAVRFGLSSEQSYALAVISKRVDEVCERLRLNVVTP